VPVLAMDVPVPPSDASGPPLMELEAEPAVEVEVDGDGKAEIDGEGEQDPGELLPGHSRTASDIFTSASACDTAFWQAAAALAQRDEKWPRHRAISAPSAPRAQELRACGHRNGADAARPRALTTTSCTPTPLARQPEIARTAAALGSLSPPTKSAVATAAPRATAPSSPNDTPLTGWLPASTATAATAAAFQCVRGFASYNVDKRNQDACIVAEDPATDTVLFAVLDGHGSAGHVVTTRFREQLATRLFDHPRWRDDVRLALRATLHTIEAELVADASVPTDLSGTTCACAVIRGQHDLTVANIGDSRVLLVTRAPDAPRGYRLEQMVADHKPDTPAERARIEAGGGIVQSADRFNPEDGPQRVWDSPKLRTPGLAMSRSLGDTIAHTRCGVTSEPEFASRYLAHDRDAFLVLASDGLSEFTSNDEVLEQIVASSNSGDNDLGRACETVVAEARRRWLEEEEDTIDDTTTIIVGLHGWGSVRGPGVLEKAPTCSIEMGDCEQVEATCEDASAIQAKKELEVVKPKTTRPFNANGIDDESFGFGSLLRAG